MWPWVIVAFLGGSFFGVSLMAAMNIAGYTDYEEKSDD